MATLDDKEIAEIEAQWPFEQSFEILQTNEKSIESGAFRLIPERPFLKKTNFSLRLPPQIASLDCSLRSAAIGKQLHCYLNLNVEILEHLAANDRNQASQSGLGLIKSLNEYDSKRLQLAASGIIRMAEMRRGLYTEITTVRYPTASRRTSISSS